MIIDATRPAQHGLPSEPEAWTPRRPIHGREFGLFALSSASFQAARLLVQLVAASVLVPEAFGLWGLIAIVLTYTTHANLGILSGANRRIPMSVGAGRPHDVDAVESAALWGAMATGLVTGSAILIVGTAVAGLDPLIGLTLALAVLLQQGYAFYQVSLRARLEFDRASIHQLIMAIAFLGVGAVGVAAHGLPGLVFAQAGAYLAGMVVALRWRRGLLPRWDGATLRSLIGEGLPIMLAGLVFAGATSVDRWIIALFGEQAMLGPYVLASTLTSAILFLSLLISQQTYPRMAMAVGAEAGGPELRRLAGRHARYAALLVAPMAIGLVAIAPVGVPIFFPAYLSAIPAVQILAVAYAILAIAGGHTNLLVATGHARSLVAVYMMSTVLTLPLGIAALALGAGPSGIATSMCFGFLAVVAMSFALVHRRVR